MTRADADIARVLGGDADTDAGRAADALAARADSEGLADVVFGRYESPLGTGLVAATDRGIVSVALPGREETEFLDGLAAGLSPRVLELPSRLDEARRELDEYFEGRRDAFDLELDWRLVRTGFMRSVLRATAQLPYGATASYGEVARSAGNPRAYRAAGTALGENPIPIIVPCHRVLRAGGVLGNYGGGPEMKRWLLELEGAIEA